MCVSVCALPLLLLCLLPSPSSSSFCKRIFLFWRVTGRMLVMAILCYFLWFVACGMRHRLAVPTPCSPPLAKRSRKVQTMQPSKNRSLGCPDQMRNTSGVGRVGQGQVGGREVKGAQSISIVIDFTLRGMRRGNWNN